MFRLLLRLLLPFLRWSRRFARPGVVCLVVVFGCAKVESTLSYLGVANAPQPSTIEVDILCDYGGAPCTPERLHTVDQSVFSQVALRPDSVVRLWWLGNTVGETSVIASFTVPATRGSSLRARDAQRKTIVDKEAPAFDDAAAPLFRDFKRRRSPIIESLGKIAMASTARSREIWLTTDLLEENLWFLECGDIPDEDSFRKTVAPILPPDSLRGVRVTAVFASPDALDRCPVYVERFRAVTHLYELAIGQAGGRFVLSPTAVPTIGESHE